MFVLQIKSDSVALRLVLHAAARFHNGSKYDTIQTWDHLNNEETFTSLYLLFFKCYLKGSLHNIVLSYPFPSRNSSQHLPTSLPPQFHVLSPSKKNKPTENMKIKTDKQTKKINKKKYQNRKWTHMPTHTHKSVLRWSATPGHEAYPGMWLIFSIGENWHSFPQRCQLQTDSWLG